MQIQLDEKGIDHDNAVIQANENLLELFHIEKVVQKEVQKESEELSEEHAADIAPDDRSSASNASAALATTRF